MGKRIVKDGETLTIELDDKSSALIFDGDGVELCVPVSCVGNHTATAIMLCRALTDPGSGIIDFLEAYYLRLQNTIPEGTVIQ